LQRFFVTAARGLEPLLTKELLALGVPKATTAVAGVACEGAYEDMLRTCLWSRIASRVMLPLVELEGSGDADAIYQVARQIAWESHFDVTTSFSIAVTGHTPEIANTQFASVRVKDAIVDRFRDLYDERPSVDSEDPQIQINLMLSPNAVVISLDLSGGSLHRRGYRTAIGEAPLRETLAAGMLQDANWPTAYKERDEISLLDPFCGSGTLVIEAALMLMDSAPGLLHFKFGFEHWKQHEPAIWTALINEAHKREEAAEEWLKTKKVHLEGRDLDGKMMRIAQSNAHRAGVGDLVRFTHGDVRELTTPTDTGLIICNPPYGQRIGHNTQLLPLYSDFGRALRENCGGWNVSVLIADEELGYSLGLRASDKRKLKNGALDCLLLQFSIHAKRLEGETTPAPDFANRLKKNHKKLKNWAKREEIDCYRVYDADLPEYSAAVDIYKGQQTWVHVQEYAAPKTIDANKAAKRLRGMLSEIPGALGIDAGNVFIKVRSRQRGSGQYEKIDSSGELHTVNEGFAKLGVNFTDYLDTGLFLDHRPIRRWIAENSRGKRFLNLFCYTATGTVQAAIGGAKSSTSVDMSNTYLEWAEHNFRLNQLDANKHKLERANVLQWLWDAWKTNQQFDLIFLDPPAFSNSKKMQDTFDIQRDHVELIQHTMRLLAPGGQLVFSNNLRKFKMAADELEDFSIEEITSQTIDPDFERNQKIHNCWMITHAGKA
jgi:23S rRNA (guanine2445-N2)-methyltransferase / 23S rRNA (guanine2069-N7)-methyltransferase